MNIRKPPTHKKTTKLCVISFKECWQDKDGIWYSSGGFPLQIKAISSLFDELILLITQVECKSGGIPLPHGAQIVPMVRPDGKDIHRKISVMLHLSYYIRTMKRHINKADVVHTPLPGDLPFIGMLISLFMRKHLIARYGGSWAETNQTTFMNRVTKVLLRIMASERNVVFATGEGLDPPAEGLHWIYVTALTDQELESIEIRLNRGLSDPPRLIYVGRLSPEKGVEYLIRALSILKREGINNFPRLAIAGDGPELNALQNLIRSFALDNYIVFTGQLDRKSLSYQLNQADICVQPSLTEGFSKAWLDAMAHGLPVLSSEVGAASSVIGRQGERGWLVPPGDSDALVVCLRRVLTENRDWTVLRKRCRMYVQGQTLEAWSHYIGQICASQWGVYFSEGKIGI